MFVMTHHGTLLGRDEDCFVQVPTPDDPRVISIDVEDLPREGSVRRGPLRGIEVVHSGFGVAFLLNGRYVCAEGDRLAVRADRVDAAEWETYSLVTDEQFAAYTLSLADPVWEMERLRRRVEALTAEGSPVKIYPGCGHVPRLEFLNIDIACMQPAFMVLHPENYYIFPFVCHWEIPDASVDYVFHEDFLEHVTQLMQWQFLAEMWRVLKPGSWHRVNTPSLLWTMKSRSEFARGYDGVYTGELQWDHIALLSHGHLKEVAEAIGYREIVFTTHSQGVSPLREADSRPGPDRDRVIGNIYADLLK
ncbi:MAG: Methyltransferase type 11 [Frankiales bacterium]|nr:Methyltransferase type 11 [Frankiales bacterium]